MRCPACDQDTDPTLAYCLACGNPLDLTAEAIAQDEEIRSHEIRLKEAVKEAKGFMVLGLFLLGVVIAFRVVLIESPPLDHVPGYRVPVEVVEEQVPAPPELLDVPRQEVPVPGAD